MTPKAFISYSWTTPEHIEWVKKLGQDLMDSGVEVILDKWDLLEGHDSNAFMERMVTDSSVTKVIMVCDRAYAEKADGRRGGAGTEAQIISPVLYGKTDQDKFVAVIRERDEEGREYVPTFFKGRIYIDLLEESTQVEQFERLVRWCFGKRLDVKPALGKPPTYITEDANTIRLTTSVPFRRAVDAIRNSRPHAKPAVNEYFNTVLAEMEKLRIGDGEQDFDDRVIASIEAFNPQRSELVELFVNISEYRPDEQMAEAVHAFFEALIPFMHNPMTAGAFRTWDVDNYRFIVIELLLYYLGTMIAHQQFDMAARLLRTPFYMGPLADNRSEPMSNFSEFMQSLQSLAHREQRLNTHRRVPEAALLMERCKGLPILMRHLKAADLVLYLRALRQGFHWYPFTLTGFHYSSVQIETFARARDHAYFDRIKGMIGVANEREFVDLVRASEAQSNRHSSGWGQMRGLAGMVGLDAIEKNAR